MLITLRHVTRVTRHLCLFFDNTAGTFADRNLHPSEILC